MVQCHQKTESGTCRVSGASVANREDACRACLKVGVPEQGSHNHVTASLRFPDATDEERTKLQRFLRRANEAPHPTPPPPSQGVGTELKALLSRIGLVEKSGCNCNRRRLEMDGHGIPWCRENLDTIVAWLREEAEKRGLPFVDFAARQIVRLAIRRAEKKEKKTMPTNDGIVLERPPRHPLPKGVTKWAVGITSAPRKNPTLARCVRSVQRGGFDPIVFAEPGTETADVDAEIVTRPERLGCWRNYVQTLRDLLERFPEAQAVMIVQDDVVFAPELREFLESELWPSTKVGCVSLYTPNYPSYEEHHNGSQPGLLKVNHRHLIGACAMVYPRETVRKILGHPLANDWKGVSKGPSQPDPAKKKAVDTWVGYVTRDFSVTAYWLDQCSRARWESTNAKQAR